jgi:hypothetical protein
MRIILAILLFALPAACQTVDLTARPRITSVPSGATIPIISNGTSKVIYTITTSNLAASIISDSSISITNVGSNGAIRLINKTLFDGAPINTDGLRCWDSFNGTNFTGSNGIIGRVTDDGEHYWGLFGAGSAGFQMTNGEIRNVSPEANQAWYAFVSNAPSSRPFSRFGMTWRMNHQLDGTDVVQGYATTAMIWSDNGTALTSQFSHMAVSAFGNRLIWQRQLQPDYLIDQTLSGVPVTNEWNYIELMTVSNRVNGGGVGIINYNGQILTGYLTNVLSFQPLFYSIIEIIDSATNRHHISIGSFWGGDAPASVVKQYTRASYFDTPSGNIYTNNGLDDVIFSKGVDPVTIYLPIAEAMPGQERTVFNLNTDGDPDCYVSVMNGAKIDSGPTLTNIVVGGWKRFMATPTGWRIVGRYP